MNHSNLYRTFLIIASFSFIVLLQSCEHDIDSIDSSSQTFLGKEDTDRNYETTTWLFEADSDVPLVEVPDSLYGSLSIDSILIVQGMVKQTSIDETLVPYDISWNIVSNPSLYNGSFQLKTSEEHYDLNTELQCIINKRPYSNSINQGIGGAIYFENGELFDIIFDDSTKETVLVKPLGIGANWIRESHTYKNDNGDTELFQQECVVVSQEEVEVKAGKFLAYKVEIMNHWVNLNSKSIRSYEYYAPEVGLILEEHDANVHQTSISLPGGATTIYFRQKYRKELVSYNFMEK